MSSFTYTPGEYAGTYPTDQDHVPLVLYSNINQGASFTKPLELHGYTSTTVFTHPTPTDKQKRSSSPDVVVVAVALRDTTAAIVFILTQ